MNKKVILVVDDEPANIAIVANLLHEIYSVRVATSGKDALERVEQERPDLILLDVVMPQMDGYEVATKLKASKETVDIPFIFLTAKNDPQSVVQGFNYGAVDYISKPFSKEELLARVSTHLKIYELQKSLSSTVNTLETKIEELDTSKKEFEVIFNQSHNGIALIDLDTNFLLTNDSYSRMTGLTREELLQTSCLSLTDNDAIELTQESIQTVIEKGQGESIIKKCILKDKTIYVNTSISLMPDKKSLLLNTVDITDLKKAESKIAHYVELMDTNIVSSTTDLNGIITEVSKAFCEISGFSKDELIGQTHNVIRHEDMPSELFENLWKTIEKNLVWNGEVKNKTKDGNFYWAELTIFLDFDTTTGKKIGYSAIRQDITNKKRIEELAIHDELTGLYNRRYFNRVIKDEINRTRRDNKSLYFMMLDVDYFKLYNDTYGHQEGDSVLEKIGYVLNTFSKRAGDFAFRLGGEEFAILFSGLSHKEATSFSNEVRQGVEDLKIPHLKNSVSDLVTVSIGLVTKNPSDSIKENELYKNADDMLYEAKESGRNRVSSLL